MTQPRNDRRTPAHDVFGKPGISYDAGDHDFPQIIETRTGRRGETPKEYLTPHGRYPGALLTTIKTTPGDNTDINVTEVYETLPGAWLPSREYDPLLGAIQTRRRIVVYADQVAALTLTDSLTYESRDGSSIIAWEIEKINSDGTGSEGNPTYPITVRDFYDEERGAVQETTQLVAATGSEVGSLTLAGSTVTKISYDPYNQYLLKKTVATWTMAGPLVTSHSYNDKGELVTKTTQNVIPTTSPTADSLLTQKSDVVGKNVAESTKVLEVLDAHVPTVITSAFEDAQGEVGTETHSIVAPATALTAESDLVLAAKRTAISATKADLVVRSVESQPIVYSYDQEEETRLWIQTSFQIVPATTSTAPTLPSVGAEVRYKNLGKARAMKISTVFNGGNIPPSRTEVKEVDYVYPSLLLSIASGMLVAHDGSGEFKIGFNPLLRSGFRRKVNGTVTITYHTSQPSPIAATIIQPIDAYAKGIFLQYSIPNVITNAWSSSSFTTGTDNPKWPYFVETAQIDASTPSLTAYLALSEITLSCFIREWKFGIWRKEVLTIPAL